MLAATRSGPIRRTNSLSLTKASSPCMDGKALILKIKSPATLRITLDMIVTPWLKDYGHCTLISSEKSSQSTPHKLPDSQ
jgi:hypothetical protein